MRSLRQGSLRDECVWWTLRACCRTCSTKSATVTVWCLMFSTSVVWQTRFADDKMFLTQAPPAWTCFCGKQNVPVHQFARSACRISDFRAFFPQAAPSISVPNGLPRSFGAESCLASPSTVAKRLCVLPCILPCVDRPGGVRPPTGKPIQLTRFNLTGFLFICFWPTETLSNAAAQAMRIRIDNVLLLFPS